MSQCEAISPPMLQNHTKRMNLLKISKKTHYYIIEVGVPIKND